MAYRIRQVAYKRGYLCLPSSGIWIREVTGRRGVAVYGGVGKRRARIREVAGRWGVAACSGVGKRQTRVREATGRRRVGVRRRWRQTWTPLLS